ncbi:Voltage-dependent anion-selective channel protein 2 [Oryzias melastigma]|uniref:Non-selective voltage-gated ion channel VDAC3 n=1 Tax=Oryzias melastigma TaxID=30732 RepID=A0A834BR55_ORYME|nr:Voltage-dependent anion-selective channel protein 2 [Oryzias melastigma]
MGLTFPTNRGFLTAAHAQCRVSFIVPCLVRAPAKLARCQSQQHHARDARGSADSALNCPPLHSIMAVPPSYSDLGKAAKDIFSKGYGFGLVKLDLKTKSQSGVEFNTSGSSNTDTGKASGSLETKYKMKEVGLSVTQKWNTDNTLATEVSVEDQLAQGLKVGLDTSFVPNTGKKSGKLKTGYKRDYVNLGCDVDFEGPIIHAAAVLGYEGWLLGYQMAFDTAKSKLSQSNFALGYRAGDFQLHTNVNDGTEFGGSIYQKVNDELETAVTLAWTAGSNNTRFGVAGKYKLDKDASLSVKVNNASLVGIGYTQSLRSGKPRPRFWSDSVSH